MIGSRCRSRTVHREQTQRPPDQEHSEELLPADSAHITIWAVLTIHVPTAFGDACLFLVFQNNQSAYFMRRAARATMRFVGANRVLRARRVFSLPATT